ncbi:hypothetical protein J6590_015526 [Homalodisca vitripennis]|nr:hypothetical protein J6590_015526 [Homalodisca vitripennis]
MEDDRQSNNHAARHTPVYDWMISNGVSKSRIWKMTDRATITRPPVYDWMISNGVSKPRIGKLKDRERQSCGQSHSEVTLVYNAGHNGTILSLTPTTPRGHRLAFKPT